MKSSLRTEALAGLTTFLTMSYIVVVNPAILSTEGTGMPFSGVMTATVLISFLMTLAMGLYAKLPFAVAPGMGINAFFTFTLVLGQGIPWRTALGMVFLSGVLFTLASATRLRVEIVRAIPPGLRSSAAAGIGIFLAFIGLKNAGLIVADPVTFVRPGGLGREALLSVLGVAVMAGFSHRKNPFAFLIGMVTVTAAAWALGVVKVPAHLVSAPDFTSVFFQLDIRGALRLAFLPAILSLLFTDLFDSISTFVGVSQASGMVDRDGQPRNLGEGLLVDALATLGSGLAGTSSATTYIESASGIAAGGRTGMTAVCTALCFLPCLFLSPLAGMVPPCATAPVLILVGVSMFGSVTALDLRSIEDALPAFLTMVLIPLTFSITQGILWGFLSHVGLYLLTGRGKEIAPMMYGLAGISLLLLAL